jgi:hypothetical protein
MVAGYEVVLAVTPPALPIDTPWFPDAWALSLNSVVTVPAAWA